MTIRSAPGHELAPQGPGDLTAPSDRLAARSPFALYDREPPPGVPVVDIDPFSSAFFDDPFPDQARLRDAGPFVWLSRYSIGVVARHAQVQEVLMDWRTFCSSRGVGMEDFEVHGRYRLPSVILEADPPEHQATKRVLLKVLSPSVLRTLRDRFAEQADAMVEELVARGRFDGVADLARAYPLRVFPDAVGMAREGREKLLPHADALFNSFGPRNELALRSRANADFEWVEAQGERDRLTPGGFGMLIHEAADRGEISRQQAVMLVRSLLQAGLDTTINALGAALHGLATHSSQWALLRADPGLAKNAFEEAIRWGSPVQTFFRTATRTTELSGVQVNEGDKLLMMLGAANRDPRRWERPDGFEITRKTTGHVGFGAGIHACVGQLLARMEGEVVLDALARRARSLELAGSPTRHHNNTLRSLATLPLEVRP